MATNGSNDPLFTTAEQKEFNPRFLDRTVIAIPLLQRPNAERKAGRTRDVRQVIIDLNLNFEGGRAKALERTEALIHDAVSDLEKVTPRQGLSRRADPEEDKVTQYFFASLDILDDVYEEAAILAREEDADTGSDWALVRLSRPVHGRKPLRIRASGKIANGHPLFAVGHPNGLPTKLANVRDNRSRAYFVANLDTYGGNSGSPVFDMRTRRVEGILVSGENDFVKHGKCFVSLVCPDSGCQGESVTRSTLWAKHIR